MADAGVAVRIVVDVTPWSVAAAAERYEDATIVLQETAFHDGIEDAPVEGYAYVELDGEPVACKGWRLHRDPASPFVLLQLLLVPKKEYEAAVERLGDDRVISKPEWDPMEPTLTVAPLTFAFRYPDGTIAT